MGENHEPPVHSCTEETPIPLFIPHPPPALLCYYPKYVYK